MAITLDQFRTISNGTHNVGQIKLSGDNDGLQKINNHVWKTGQNNVQTSAADNKAVRQALYDAFCTSHTLSEEMLNDIKTILLGGTNGSRSLSRDFVKQLIKTVDETKNQNPGLVGKMDIVSKSLSERSVRVATEEKKDGGIVTSSKSAAYTIYSNEMIDANASEAQEALKSLSKSFEENDMRDKLRLGLAMLTFNLTEMVGIDNRTAGRLNKQDVRTRFNAIYALAENANDASNEAKELFFRAVKDGIKQAYIDLGLQDVADDHLSRIFPPEFMDS